MPAKTILVALVEDDARFADALETLLNHTPGFRCESRHATGQAALEHLAQNHAHVALVDLALPDLDGVEVIRRLQRVAPRVRPLVLSRFDDADRVFAAVCAGALGYVLKAEAGRTLLGAIADVHGGDAGISPSIARRALELLRRQDVGPDHLDGALTPRETEVLEAAKAHPDWQNKDIARQLKISHRTVANHLSRIYAKLHLFGREDLGLLS